MLQYTLVHTGLQGAAMQSTDGHHTPCSSSRSTLSVVDTAGNLNISLQTSRIVSTEHQAPGFNALIANLGSSSWFVVTQTEQIKKLGRPHVRYLGFPLLIITEALPIYLSHMPNMNLVVDESRMYIFIIHLLFQIDNR